MISMPSSGFLARTKSRLLAISLEDLLGVIDQPNIPGTVNEHPNWRRRLPARHRPDRGGDRRRTRSRARPATGPAPRTDAQVIVTGERNLSSKIEDYGLIGDCETAALVGRDGSIDWLCWPAFDSDACFAALLGTPGNGRWLIAPAEEVKKRSRRYWDNTLILETRFETAGGVVALIDFMPPRGKASDVVRLVRGVSGRVKLRMQLVIRFGFGADIPWVKRTEDGALLAICGPDMTVLRTPVETRGEDMTTVAEFEVGEGETIPFVLTYGPSHLPVPEADRSRAGLAGNRGFLDRVVQPLQLRGRHRELVMRSLITLKALTYGPTGGIVAAPTTSLPEKLGGAAQLGLPFLLAARRHLHAAGADELRLHRGSRRPGTTGCCARSRARRPTCRSCTASWASARLLEWEADWLPGYEGAKPVRVGNAAHAQLQLDVYGELIDAFHQSRMAELQLDEASWALECAVLEHLAEVWDQPDHGIWERRGERQALCLVEGHDLGRLRPRHQERGKIRFRSAARALAGVARH